MENRIAICAVAKNEENYLVEWVDYYKGLGVSHIYLFDNNNVERGNSVAKLLSGYGNFVTVYNVRGINSRLPDGEYRQDYIYRYCFKQYRNEYDWIGFFDLDEFVTFNDCDMHSFFANDVSDDTSVIHLNWMYYGDNGLLYPDGRGVVERFKTPCPYDVHYAQTFEENMFVKSFVNCRYHMLRSLTHSFIMDGGCCRKNNGDLSDFRKCIEEYDYTKSYIRHYGTKTIAEYMERRTIGTVISGDVIDIDTRIKWFFNVNKITDEKLSIVSDFLKERNIKSKLYI